MANLNEGYIQTEVECNEESSGINKSYKKSENLTTKHKVENYTSKICAYFSKTGYCKFGNSCKYKHKKRAGSEKRLPQSFVKQSTVPKNTYKEKSSVKDNSFTPLLNSNLQKTIQVCRFFMAGHCDKEDNCKFRHSLDLRDDEICLNEAPLYQKIVKKTYTANNRTYKKRSTPLCYYFKRGQCYKGDQCKYYHQNTYFSNSESSYNLDSAVSSTLPDEDSNVVAVKESSKKDNPVVIFNKSLNVYDLSSLTMEDMPLLRAAEIRQLKKRFPHHETLAENKTFSFIFQPSDPDWPFDVKNLKVEVEFSEDYPKEKCAITVVEEAGIIPQLLIKHLNKTIYDWINKKYEENSASNILELIFRPFLKWIDKNLEELFITGLRKVKQDLKAKEDGIEFVPAENLFPSSENSKSCDNLVNEEGGNQEIAELPLQISNQTASNPKKSLSISDENKPFQYISNDGMKLLLSELELIDGAAALVCTKISVTLQCCRCKTSFSMKSVPKKNNSHVCSKCSKNVGFTFEPNTAHQFSNVIGNLHLLESVAVDVNLVECHFLVDCLNCSKQVPVDGIHYGQKHKMWCMYCNEKMTMSIGCVKFQALKLSAVSGLKYLPAKKIEKRVKDPVVKEGEPLPNFGACKHYKKSNRWLRFPCCGRLYPCDECHNEKETDHEMKYASRMICGFCAKEQPYSKEKPCFVCSQNLTKKSGSHWEGGKGCRNKTQMCREDKQKYAGISKTVSKKAQSAKTKKKS